MYVRCVLLFLLILLSSLTGGRSYNMQPQQQEDKDSIRYKAEVTRIDKSFDPDVIRLIGNVSFTHDSVTMYCDSAHLNESKQYIDAWSNIRIVRERGSEVITGTFLKYDGNIKLAEIWESVEAWNNDAKLNTEQLFYNMADEIIYYTVPGRIVHGTDTIVSQQGKYFTLDKFVWFQGNVHVNNEKYEMFTDTLNYDTQSTLSEFFGPSTLSRLIEKDTIKSEGGWFHTQDSIAFFYNNVDAWSGSYRLTCDSLLYSNKDSTGYARMNVTLVDTTQHFSGSGDYVRFRQVPESIMLTDRAMVMYYDGPDTLYLHGDTIRSNMVNHNIPRTRMVPVIKEVLPDTLNIPDISEILPDTLDMPAVAAIPPDTLGVPAVAAIPDTLSVPLFREEVMPDSIIQVRLLRSYGRVKFYRTDIQGVCDSLVFSFGDSIAKMLGKPILWSDLQQATSDSMRFYFEGGHLSKSEFFKNAIMAMQDDTDALYFNQIRGGKITGFFNDSAHLVKLQATIDASSFYLPKDNNIIIGGNKAGSDTITIFMEEQKADKVRFTQGGEGVLLPFQDIKKSKQDKLEGFFWFMKQRPRKPSDIFEWIPEESD